MKIGLYDVDSTIPNLALMKLSAFHKERGDEVVPFLHNMRPDAFDKVYASTVFKDQPDDDLSDHSYLYFNQKARVCEKQLDDESICGCHCKFKVSTRARRNRKGKVNG